MIIQYLLMTCDVKRFVSRTLILSQPPKPIEYQWREMGHPDTPQRIEKGHLE